MNVQLNQCDPYFHWILNLISDGEKREEDFDIVSFTFDYLALTRE